MHNHIQPVIAKINQGAENTKCMLQDIRIIFKHACDGMCWVLRNSLLKRFPTLLFFVQFRYRIGSTVWKYKPVCLWGFAGADSYPVLGKQLVCLCRCHASCPLWGFRAGKSLNHFMLCLQVELTQKIIKTIEKRKCKKYCSRTTQSKHRCSKKHSNVGQ